MRLNLEEFDFNIEYIQGKSNATADALSRIITTSDELKSMNLLVVNTRSMTRKTIDQNNKQAKNLTQSNDRQTKDKEPDHLTIYTTDIRQKLDNYLNIELR